MYGRSGDQRWAIRVLRWEELTRSSAIELLRWVFDVCDLAGTGTKFLLVPPVQPHTFVTRWLAENALVPGI